MNTVELCLKHYRIFTLHLILLTLAVVLAATQWHQLIRGECKTQNLFV